MTVSAETRLNASAISRLLDDRDFKVFLEWLKDDADKALDQLHPGAATEEQMRAALSVRLMVKSLPRELREFTARVDRALKGEESAQNDMDNHSPHVTMRVPD